MLFQHFVAPVQKFLNPVAGIKFEWIKVDKSVKFLSLNIYVIYVFVNKILAHVIWKSFSFHFIQI